MTQPTALFLADILESRNGNPTGFGLGPVCDKAAAELRRLHAQRDALLDALRPFAAINASIGFTYKDVDRARAAIKTTEGGSV